MKISAFFLTVFYVLLSFWRKFLFAAQVCFRDPDVFSRGTTVGIGVTCCKIAARIQRSCHLEISTDSKSQNAGT